MNWQNRSGGGSARLNAKAAKGACPRQEQPMITAFESRRGEIDAAAAQHQKQVMAALRDRERELSQLVDMVPSHLWR